MLEITELKKLHDKAYTQSQQTREMASDDIIFANVTQWDDQLLNASQLQYRGEFNIINKAIKQVVADVTSNPVSVNFESTDQDRSDAGELMTGIYRTSEKDNCSIEAFDNGLREAVICGVGGWRLETEYKTLRSGDREQVIKRKPIYEANNTVMWDPNAKLLDKSDAKFVSILHAYSEDGYKDLVFELTGEETDIVNPSSFATPEQSFVFPWFSGSKHIYVSEFYHREEIEDTILFMTDPLGMDTVLRASELTEVMDEMIDAGYEIVDEKKTTRFEVTKYIASGQDIIYSAVIAGEHIPVVPVYGERSFAEDEETWRGVVRLAKDPQRLRNFQLSYLADIVSKSPRPKPIFSPEQLQGFEFMYEESGSENHYPYLLQNLQDVNGRDLPQGPLNVMPEATAPSALLQMIGLSREAVEDVANPGLPQAVADTDLSGKAVIALQNRLDMQNKVYQDHFKHAKRRDGVIFASMAAEVYDSPRDMKMTNTDGTTKTVRMYQMVIDRTTGEATPINDIRNIEFEVYTEIGPAYSTQKQQTRDEMIELMGMMSPQDPMYNVLMLKYIKLLDGSDMEDVRKHANKQLIMQGIKEPETEEEAAILAQAQQVEPQPDAMLIAAQAEMVKAQADMAREQREAAKDERDSNVDVSKLAIDEFKAATERMKVQVSAVEAGVKVDKISAEAIGVKLDNAKSQKELEAMELQSSLQNMTTEQLMSIAYGQ